MISHPFLEVRITLPIIIIISNNYHSILLDKRFLKLPATKADFITPKMYIIILEYFLTDFTEETFQKSPCGIRFWIDGSITTVIKRITTLAAFDFHELFLSQGSYHST